MAAWPAGVTLEDAAGLNVGSRYIAAADVTARYWRVEIADTANAAGKMMLQMLGVFAEFEREILRERVRAGLAHARQNGQRLGRPLTAALHADEVRKLYRAGTSKAAIARRLNIGRTSVRRILSTRR